MYMSSIGASIRLCPSESRKKVVIPPQGLDAANFNFIEMRDELNEFGKSME